MILPLTQCVTYVHLIAQKLVLNHRHDGPLIRYEICAAENDHMENELRIRRNGLHSLSDSESKIQRVKLLSIFPEEFQRIFPYSLSSTKYFDDFIGVVVVHLILDPLHGASKSKFFQLFLFFH